MSIEDDLRNAMRYTGFGRRVDPTAMIHQLLKNMEISMLNQMMARIKVRIDMLQGTPEEDSMDPFNILGVKPDSTREEVDKAFRGKARTAHPDVGGSNEEMMKINAAYEAIRLFKNWKVR